PRAGVTPVGRQPMAPSKGVGTDGFPAIALAERVTFVVVERFGALRELLDVAAGGGRGVQEQDAARVAASVLPGMRHVAREERAGAGAADVDFVSDLERDLAGEHPRRLRRCRGGDGRGSWCRPARFPRTA